MKKLKFIVSYVRFITCLLLHRNFGKNEKKKKHLLMDTKIKIYLIIQIHLFYRQVGHDFI